jgi:hypothetical protein
MLTNEAATVAASDGELFPSRTRFFGGSLALGEALDWQVDAHSHVQPSIIVRVKIFCLSDTT